MTFENFGIILAIVTGLIGLGVSAYLHLYKFVDMEIKLELIWNFLMERAMASMITNGLGTINSPLMIEDKAVEWFDPVKSELKALYHKNPKLHDYQLAFEIQKQFGDWITKNVCIKHGIANGECLLIATSIAKSK